MDELIEQAKELLKDREAIGSSFLQRMFRIGYPRAAHIIDVLQEMGLITKDWDASVGGYRVPAQSSKNVRREDLEKQVRKSGTLEERLKECRKRIGKMCKEGRPPKMTIPVQWYDDDFFISVTLQDAIATQQSLERMGD